MSESFLCNNCAIGNASDASAVFLGRRTTRVRTYSRKYTVVIIYHTYIHTYICASTAAVKILPVLPTDLIFYFVTNSTQQHVAVTCKYSGSDVIHTPSAKWLLFQLQKLLALDYDVAEEVARSGF